MSASTVGTALPPRAECGINLDAIRHNVRSLARRLDNAQFWAVVKANAYGHDVDRVCDVVVPAGAKRLCVATLSEARHLRQGIGIRVPMLIMGPLDAASMRRAVDLDVSITVLSWNMIDALEHVVRADGRPARIHLKVDTGMGRWGIPEESLDAALDRIAACPGVELEGIMTHFATADDPSSDFFDQQRDRFEHVVARVRERSPHVIAHAANSAATLRDSSAHFDAVRCGIALYGMSPAQGDPAAEDLRPAMSVRSYVADIRTLQPGQSVGYCRTFVAEEPCRIALVPIGYADGVARLLSNRGEALVGGRRHTMVGNVSMDHMSLLVDEQVNAGDVVTVLGADGDDRILAEDHARWAGTINYEVTCGVAGEPRLARSHAGAE